MNVLLATTLFEPGAGGKENYLARLADGLRGRGCAVRCLARFDRLADHVAGRLRFEGRTRLRRADVEGLAIAGPARLAAAALGPAVVRPAWNRLAGRLAVALFGPPCLEPVRWADVVHFDGIGFELIGLALLAAARRIGRPLVVVPHLHVGRWGDGPLDRRLYRAADRLVAKTEAEAAFLVGVGVEAGRVAVIPNGPILARPGDGEAFRSARGIAGRLVLFLGRRTPEKGFDVFARAAERIVGRRPDVVLAAAGPGPIEGDPGPVRDLGYLSESDKADALAACDVLCVPSPVEAFGIVYLEAWASGKPVVAGPSDQVASLVRDGVDGRTVEPIPAIVAGAIEALLDDPARARRMGEAGRAKVDRGFGWEGIVARTLAVYEAAIRGRG